MTPDLEHPTYRLGLATGRALAIRDVTAMINRLSRTVEPEHGSEVTLGTLVQNWLDLVAWLDQAEQEAAVELQLIESTDTA